MMTTMLADDAVSAADAICWLALPDRTFSYLFDIDDSCHVNNGHPFACTLLALTFYHQSTTPAVSVTEWTGPR